ncbi:hypothetical protein AVEN_215602-1 [Araneus ventricosus]|uniref:Uncharacterized protein n=1 Tax=Araneus ventricosus TaxID=182803 RepID=A0A4Y2S8Q9_ARAVE|nr:hypothetical protein AVEN_215602-1 [Araneus ventricosus]
MQVGIQKESSRTTLVVLSPQQQYPISSKNPRPPFYQSLEVWSSARWHFFLKASEGHPTINHPGLLQPLPRAVWQPGLKNISFCILLRIRHCSLPDMLASLTINARPLISPAPGMVSVTKGRSTLAYISSPRERKTASRAFEPVLLARRAKMGAFQQNKKHPSKFMGVNN